MFKTFVDYWGFAQTPVVAPFLDPAEDGSPSTLISPPVEKNPAGAHARGSLGAKTFYAI